MKNNKFIHIIFILSSVLFIMAHTQTQYPYYCLQYRSSQCIRCPLATHIYQNQCYNDTIGCLQYQNGDQCIKCNTTISYRVNNTCVLTISESEIRNSYQLAISASTRLVEQFFVLISSSQAQKDNFFKSCDNFMKNGQYSHFISRSDEAIISVHTYDQNNVRQFKILYEGSGGGIFMCLIGINMVSNQITLRSLVVIGVHQVVPYCIDYTTQSQCNRCNFDYHLQNKLCYKNIPKCIRYFKDICIECRGSSLLIENRCISDCNNLRDTRSIRFYHNQVVGGALTNIERTYLSSM